MVSGIEKAQIKSRLLSLSIDKLKELRQTLQLPLKDNSSSNELIDYITEKVITGEIEKQTIFNLVDYFQISDRIEHKTLGLKREHLGKLVGMKVDRNTSRDVLINRLRGQILAGKINVNELRGGNIFLKNKLEKVKKNETIAYVASKLLGERIERFSSEDLVNLGLGKVEAGEITEEELLDIIEKARKETTSAQKRKIEGPTLLKIEKEIDSIRGDIREIKKLLSTIDEERHGGFIRRYRDDTDDRIADFMKKIKLIEKNNSTELRYDRLLAEIKRQGSSIEQFFEKAMLVCLLDNLCDIAARLRLSLSTDDFFTVLTEEIDKAHFVTRPIIHKLKNSIGKRLEISSEEFNQYLLDCRARGLIDLIEGAPASGTEDDWLDIEGRRYYYLEIRREK